MTGWFSGFVADSPANASAVGILLFKVTVLLAAALVADAVLHRKFNLACAAMWNGVLLALAILPLVGLALPAVRVTQTARPIEGPQGQVAPAAADDVGEKATVEVAPSHQTARSLVQDELATGDHRDGSGIIAAGVGPVSGALLALYLIGCGASLLRLFNGLRVVVRLRGSCSEIMNSAWTDRLHHWQKQCGIGQSVSLKESHTVSVPVVVGHWAPVIILPAKVAAGAEEKTRDAVLVHELAHVARRDYGWQMFQRLLSVALWFHPLFWLAQRRLRFLRERVCDEFAVYRLGSANDYIETLLQMAARLTRSPAVSLGMAVLRSSHLGERLAAIRDSRGCRSCRANGGLRLGMLAAALALAGCFGRAAIAEPEVPRIEGLTVDAQSLLDEFDAEAKRLRDEAERKVAAKRAELEVQLRALQTHYTRQDKLDEAVAIRDQIRLLKAATIAEGTPLTMLNDPGTMSQYAQAVGKSFFIKVVGSNSGWLWGTDQYTHDSSVAAAAVHSGVLQLGETGVVKVTMLPGSSAYIGSQRNGITSHDWPNTMGGYVSFKIERAPPEIEALAKFAAHTRPAWNETRIVEPKSMVFGYPGLIDAVGLSSLRSYQGQSFLVRVTGTADPNVIVWGSDVYTDDSSLAAAAVHTGALRPGETGTVRVTILPGQASYEGSEKNGITSHPWVNFGGSYSVKRVGSAPGPRDAGDR